MSFIRTEMLFGKEAMNIFKDSIVAVAGLGGVGSAAAEMLARSGIGTFILNDFDNVSQTDINRQLIAVKETVGKPKTSVLADRIRAINPDAVVIEHQMFCDETNRDSIFQKSDFIVDAIDSLGPKTGLIEYAHINSKKIISCMGAGNRTDPSKIAISDISEAEGCPLLKRVKKYLRKRGITNDIPVVYSIEQPVLSAEPITAETYRGRNRVVIGSVSYIPVIMGCWAASFVLRSLSRGKN